MTDDALDLAEKYLLRGEAAGMAHATPGERASAKLAIAEGYRKDQKQDQVGEASSASEPGGVVGATPGGGDDAVAIAEQIDALRRGPTTQESMKERAKLNEKLGSILDKSNLTVAFTRD